GDRGVYSLDSWVRSCVARVPRERSLCRKLSSKRRSSACESIALVSRTKDPILSQVPLAGGESEKFWSCGWLQVGAFALPVPSPSRERIGPTTHYLSGQAFFLTSWESPWGESEQSLRPQCRPCPIHHPQSER